MMPFVFYYWLIDLSGESARHKYNVNIEQDIKLTLLLVRYANEVTENWFVQMNIMTEEHKGIILLWMNSMS